MFAIVRRLTWGTKFAFGGWTKEGFIITRPSLFLRLMNICSRGQVYLRDLVMVTIHFLSRAHSSLISRGDDLMRSYEVLQKFVVASQFGIA